ncbi:MAG: hypothetical protein JNK29_12585, partial [Anaerolineales bacterium]|nr:hypothetical protein [Anaerolineales bacterium]
AENGRAAAEAAEPEELADAETEPPSRGEDGGPEAGADPAGEDALT